VLNLEVHLFFTLVLTYPYAIVIPLTLTRNLS
jgi:hypothetical protein